MAIIKLNAFTGEAPRVTARLLPASGAQIAQSVRLEDGKLSPFRKPYSVANLVGAVAGDVKTIYRHLGDWLHWDEIVHAVPGPVAEDRLYYTGDGVPKMLAGGVTYDLAIAPPAGALTAVLGGVIGAVYNTRLYVYTWVTDFGEESEPNPVSNALNVSPGNTVTLSGFVAAPGGRNITKQRIYRSQTGTSGGTQFYFIHERAATNVNYVDSLTTDDFDAPLPSQDFNPPPADLFGLVAMPGGIMAGISGKDICFCEPYQPHAWPEKYRLALNYDGVALGVYGNTLVAGTTGVPYLIGGTHPENMTPEKLELNMPCLSTAGMVDLGYAIAYPSNDGLVVVQNGAASVPSAQLFTRDQWLALEPDVMVCGQFYGRFFGSYDYTDTAGADQVGSIIMDLTGDMPFVIRTQHKADAFFHEVGSSALYLCMGTTVYEWDSKLGVQDVYTWKSKKFVLPAPSSFGAMLLEVDETADFDAILAYETELAAVAAANIALFAGDLMGGFNAVPFNTYPVNGDALQAAPVGPTVAVNIYADGVLLDTVTTLGEIERIKGDELARQWEIEVTGNISVQDVIMAGTAQELRNA